MNPTSQVIKTIIDNTPGYSLDILLADLGAKQGPEFLTSQEVQKLLKISRLTLHRWRKKGIIQGFSAGENRNIKYRKNEVLAVMKPAKNSK